MRHSAAKSYPKPSIRITGKSKPTQPLPMTAESADSQQSLLFSPLLFQPAVVFYLYPHLIPTYCFQIRSLSTLMSGINHLDRQLDNRVL
jgi:hypothetical protein